MKTNTKVIIVLGLLIGIVAFTYVNDKFLNWADAQNNMVYTASSTPSYSPENSAYNGALDALIEQATQEQMKWPENIKEYHDTVRARVVGGIKTKVDAELYAYIKSLDAQIKGSK